MCLTALKLSRVTNFSDMLSLTMGFICQSDENKFVLISGGHISNSSIDPLHVRGNAANLEDRTILFLHENRILIPRSDFFFVLQIGCIPMMCKRSVEALRKCI